MGFLPPKVGDILFPARVAAGSKIFEVVSKECLKPRKNDSYRREGRRECQDTTFKQKVFQLGLTTPPG